MKKYNYVKGTNLNSIIWRFSVKTQNNILCFKKKEDVISDDDIMAMMMGLIKLVRSDERKKILNNLRNAIKF